MPPNTPSPTPSAPVQRVTAEQHAKAEADAARVRRLIYGRELEDRARAQSMRVVEERTYRVGGPHSFLRDLRVAREDPQARDRLARHRLEFEASLSVHERAGMNLTAGTGGEFAYPLWVPDGVVQARVGRPLLNALGVSPWPTRADGSPVRTSTIDVPKWSTGASGVVQAPGAAVTQTSSPTTTSVAAGVVTVAARFTVAQQLLDLGGTIAEANVLRDCQFAIDEAQDLFFLSSANQTGAVSVVNASGTNAVTYTDASPAPYKVWAPVAQAASAITKQGVAADVCVMHPSTWWWIAGTADSSNRPIEITQPLAFDSPATNTQYPVSGGARGVVGQIAGIPVICDANMPTNLGAGTNQTAIVVMSQLAHAAYETPAMVEIAFQADATTLQSELVVRRYFAFTLRQPAFVSVIQGTGLIPQAGY